MTEFDESSEDSLDAPDDGLADDYDHDILLVAGSRPEVVREPLGPNPATVAAVLLTRLDDLLVDLDPSAIMVHGGGMTAAVTAMTAFWRQIPVVHLQAGVASDDLLCPFPQEANRRVIGQLASLFLTTGGAAMGGQLGPNANPVGDTLNANPPAVDLRFARLIRRVRSDGTRIVLVGLDRPDSLGVLAGLPDLLEREIDIEVVLFGELAAHGAGSPLQDHPRATVARTVPLPELVGLVAASVVLVSDDPELVADAPGLGTPAVYVDGPHVQEPGDSIRSIGSPKVMATVRQVLAAKPLQQLDESDGLEAARVEQAVAWMFGLCPSPLLNAPEPSSQPSPTE
jgi:UDP-N-acetylglucosamine 2-epimerase (non-hydrolysing)